MTTIFAADIKAELNASRQMVRCFAIHTLALHSDIVHRRKILSKTALGCSKHEAAGTKSVLNSYNMADVKAIAEARKERAILAGSLFKRKAPQPSGRRRKGGGRGNGRNNRRNREQDSSSPRQSRGESTSGGDEAEHSAKKGSKDGSNKSTSTPRKKPFQRGNKK